MQSVERFLIDNQDLGPESQHNYRQMLDLLSRHYGGKQPEEMTEDEVKSYLATVKNPNTWNLRFALFRRFYHWCADTFLWEDVRGNPVYYLSKMKRKKKQARVDFLTVTPEHVSWLVKAAQNMRDKALVAVLFECGFRRGEIVKIRIGGVRVDEYGVLITCDSGKTGPRTVRGIECTALLTQWLEAHPRNKDKNAPLFCAIWPKGEITMKTRWGGEVTKPAVSVGDPISLKTVQSTLNKIVRWAIREHPELPHIYPHLGRHFAATQAAKSGRMNTQAMKDRFGWTTNQMPDVYCHLTGADADAQYLASYGITKEDEPVKITQCPKCHAGNVPGMDYCGRCGAPLTLALVEQL